MKITGIAASPGVALGPVFVYEPQQREVAQGTIAPEQADSEWRRVQTALDQARAQLTAVRDTTAQRAGPEEAAIFDAHLLVLEDEELLGSVRERIYTQHENAEAAVWGAFQTYRDMLLQIDDEYLRARAADLNDIATRVVTNLRGEQSSPFAALKQPSIVVARDLMPSDTASLDPALALGLAIEEGGPTSHTAILSRQLNIAAVVGARGLLDAVHQAQAAQNGATLLALDGAAGTVEIAPDEAALASYRAQQRQYAERRAQLAQIATLPAVTPDGHKVELLANCGIPQTAVEAAKQGAEGIGLFRTEFLFLERDSAPTEDEQVEAYLAAARPFPNGYVIVRTLDIGGDKTLPYLPQEHEENPFLGLRGLRLCLSPHFQPVFHTQLRALLRAAAQGANLRVMFPMVNDASEVAQARALFRAAADELEGEGIAAREALARMQIGAMVETPAAAATTDLLAAECDFFSLGTNDLTQYVLAVDRMNASVAPLYSSFAPSVLRAIADAITGAHSKGREIGMCGEMAGDPRATPVLLGLGLDEFSMTAQSLHEVKRVIRACSTETAREIVNEAFALGSAQEVAQYLAGHIESLTSGANTTPA